MKKITWNKKRLIPILFFLFFTAIGLAQSSQTFTATTTFSIPAGVTTVQVEAWGGGGKGSERTSNGGAGGAGGGGYSKKLVTVTPSTSYTVTVGTGSTTTGTSGNDSWFINNTTILARGGSSPASNTNTAGNGGAVGIGDVTYSGGNGAVGVNGTRSGGGGSSAGMLGNGVTATNQTGALATLLGGGGDGGDGRTNQGNGSPGIAPGGGGGGGYRNVNGIRTGGNGANGQIIISWGPEINILGNSLGITDGDVSTFLANHTEFGTVATSAGTIVRTFTIQNTGVHTLTLTTPTVTGGNAGDFAITTAPALSVAAGASTTFQVTFNPSAAGVRTTTLNIANNDATENPYNFAIGGTGGVQEMNVTGNGVGIPDNDALTTLADWTDFGTIAVSAGSITRTYTILNSGTDLLTIGAITLGGSTDFTLTASPAASVAAGASTTFTVTFNPSSAGIKNGTISIVNNDGDENPYNYAISGTGGQQEINVLGNTTVTIADGDITPNTGDWTDFGSVNIVGTTSVTRTFIVENTGTDVLTLSTPTITGSGDFGVSGLTGTTVAPGASVSFQVTFNPGVTGVKGATVSIANNDTDENPYNFSITGLATDPEINVRGGSPLVDIADGATATSNTDWTEFGTTNITSGTLTRTFTIQNTSTTALNLPAGAITFSGANASDFTVAAFAATTVNVGTPITVTVTFNPSAVGVRTAILNIANNDNDESPYNFAVSGTGTDCEIDVQFAGTPIVFADNSPSAAEGTDFGPVNIIGATTVVRTFTIYNSGTATMNLTIGAITFSGTASADYALNLAPSGSVAPGSSTLFSVSFNPSATGVRNAVLSIVNNDGNENPYTFSLTGNGTDPEIDLQGNGISIANNDTTPVATDWTDFGSTDIAFGSITRTFTIANLPSTSSLAIGAITLTGANASDFTFTLPTFGNLATNTSTTFTITFNPTATGTKNATVTIANNDSNENPYVFAIRGFGTDPEINLVGNFATIADGDTTPSVSDVTDFGTVSIDAGSTLVTYTIQNTGVGVLNVGAITFSGADASNFALTTAPAATVAAGGNTTFTVSFNPSVLGVKNAIITIANDDADENPYDFYITGLGVRTYPDTDGDNVSDNIDIDDDNDGIVDTLEQANCVTYPLALSSEYTFLNETFGAGTTKGLININIPGATCGYCYEDGIASANYGSCTSQTSPVLDDGEYVVTYKIAGSSSTDPENIHFDGAWNGPVDHTVGDTNGRMAVFNASFAPGIFYETTVNGIIPNVPITYGFWAMNILSQGVSGIKPNITVQFRDLSNNLISTFNTGDIGRCLASTTSDACPLSEWHQYTTSVNLGNNTGFIIRFINNANGGGGNDLAIDDITIKQQYCDRDGDAVANIFDLDSDNDGISDVEEAGFKSLTAGKGIMDLVTAGVWVDANTNGLHDNIDALIAGGTYTVPDIDGDGSSDFVDLDSDNDSVFDVDESGLLNGDGDIDGDGMGDGADTDADGFLNVFDIVVGQGTAIRAFAANTDAAGNPDYMVIDANNDGIKDITPTLYSGLDTNNDGLIDGTADVDKDGIRDAFDTTTLALGSPRDLNRKLFLDLDGRNDYAEGTQLLSGLGQATIMGWVKLTSPFSANSFILGQDNFNLKIDAGSGIKLTTTAKGVTVTYATNISVNRWYHIAAVYDGSNATEKLRLYLNGNQMIMSNSGTLAGTLATSTANFTMGKNAVASNQYFKGGIEEARAFNAALTTDQIQKMVYQEIQQNGTAVRGAVIPKNVELTSWASLLAYYRFDVYKHNVIDNYTTPTTDIGTSTSFARIYYVKNIRPQLAPLPFETTAGGIITTSVAPTGSFIFGQDVLDNVASIVRIRHNINLNFNMTNVGTFIDPSMNLVLNNNNQLRNTWYLKLDGKIDLQGRSQLVQTTGSDIDATSAGSIERDQQGTVNRFNYNYWGSPVGAINATTNNNNFTVAGVMKDGTNAANPQNILWTTGLNSSSTSPITLSSYWIFKFQNVSDSYANWSSVGPNGALLPGQGFTMKGSNANTATQNYTFVGKPHNGTITSPIAANNLNLSGNPYASAIDANQFITDNLPSLNGTIYFWEHFNTNTTHNLADYQGGYAARTLVGGTPPVSPSEISGLGSSSRVPGRFIPVGQGFFVTGNGTGGTINFNNGQRAFVRENDVNSNVLFRHGGPSTNEEDNHHGHNNNQDAYEEDTYAKIRLGFNSANNYHRQTLLGFMDDKATPAWNPGYDAKHIDAQPNDMYYMIGTEKATIQGDDYFNTSDIFPIGVKTATAGNVSFIVDSIENFDQSQEIYIYDSETATYHAIKDEKYEVSLPAGTIDNRFSLRFTNGSLGTGDVTLENGIFVAYANSNSAISIKNNLLDATAQTVSLFNMLGQSLSQWDVENQDQTNITLPVKNLSTGTYIVKIKTTKGDISKKIVIR